MSAVTLKQIVNDLGLDIFWGSELLARKVKKTQVSRPCIEVYGNYFDYFESDNLSAKTPEEAASMMKKWAKKYCPSDLKWIETKFNTQFFQNFLQDCLLDIE